MNRCLLSLFLLISVFTSSLFTYAQDIGPPSLAVSAGKVLFDEGKLDAELIAAIVATKQEEVKKELASRIILRKLQNSSFLFWNYSKNNLNNIFSETDIQTIKKQLLRNSVELITTVGVLEFYMQAHYKKCEGEDCKDLEKKAFPFTKNIRNLFVEFQAFSPQVIHEIKDKDSTAVKTPVQEYNKISLRKIVDEDLSWRGAYSKFGKLQDNDKAQAIYDYNLSKKENVFKGINFERLGKGFFFEKPFIVFRLNKLADHVFINGKSITISNLLLDLTYNVCSNNQYLQRLGIFQSINHTPERAYIDNYQYIMEIDSTAVVSKDGGLLGKKVSIKSLKKQLKKFKGDLENDIDLIAKFAYSLSKFLSEEIDEQEKKFGFDSKEHDEDYELRNEELKKSITAILRENKEGENDDIDLFQDFQLTQKLKDTLLARFFEKMDYPYNSAEITNVLNSLKENVLSEKGNFDQECMDCDRTVYRNISKLFNSQVSKNPLRDDDFYYFIEQTIQPQLLDVTINLNTEKGKKIYQQLDKLKKLIRDRLLFDLTLEMIILRAIKDDANILYDVNKIQQTFLKLISILNHLDHVKSYELILNFLKDIGNILEDKNAAKILNTLVNGGEKYTTINVDSNKLEINVESLYTDLYNRYADENGRRLSLYFSVGVNYAHPDDPIPKSETDTTDASLVFVGEKLGLKFKIFDWARKRSFYSYNQSFTTFRKAKLQRLIDRSRKPLINDFHIILFGSGLLYQIEALTTEEEFDKPVIGGSFGLSFFNGLDLNFGYAVPFNNEFKDGLFNISFDIKIAEYLSELRKKRNVKKAG